MTENTNPPKHPIEKKGDAPAKSKQPVVPNSEQPVVSTSEQPAVPTPEQPSAHLAPTIITAGQEDSSIKVDVTKPDTVNLIEKGVKKNDSEKSRLYTLR